MMEDPGSFSGKFNSPKPERGPEAKKRISLIIFKIETAKVFKEFEKAISESCEAIASNLFIAGLYLFLVILDK